jgi:hypothetical protein
MLPHICKEVTFGTPPSSLPVIPLAERLYGGES